jgi:hypothetical protein
MASKSLQTRDCYQELLANATQLSGGHDARLDTYLANPTNPIPVHTGAGHDHDDDVHWSLLTLMLGYDHSSRSSAFPAAAPPAVGGSPESRTLSQPDTPPLPASSTASHRSDTTTAPAAPGIQGSHPELSGWNAACFKTPVTYW